MAQFGTTVFNLQNAIPTYCVFSGYVTFKESAVWFVFIDFFSGSQLFKSCTYIEDFGT